MSVPEISDLPAIGVADHTQHSHPLSLRLTPNGEARYFIANGLGLRPRRH